MWGSCSIYVFENINTFLEINMITDIKRRPCGSKIKENEMWVEEIDSICHVKSADVVEEKRNKLDRRAAHERKRRVIDAWRGAMIIS